MRHQTFHFGARHYKKPAKDHGDLENILQGDSFVAFFFNTTLTLVDSAVV